MPSYPPMAVHDVERISANPVREFASANPFCTFTLRFSNPQGGEAVYLDVYGPIAHAPQFERLRVALEEIFHRDPPA